MNSLFKYIKQSAPALPPRAAALVLIYSFLCALLTSSCGDGRQGGAGKSLHKNQVLRIGHFASLTHVHALVARAMAREGRPFFEPRLGELVDVEWYTYHSGPPAMEAMLAGTLDITYVGPNPVINAFIKCDRRDVRVVSGATRGGSALVVQGAGREKVKLNNPRDFAGRRVATPQIGNTQDVALRAYLAAGGMRVNQMGGDVMIIPTAGPDQLMLFQKGELDAAWTVEPWVSRIEMECGGRILQIDPQELTTVVAATDHIINNNSGLVAKFLAAHAELSDWICKHPEEARHLVAAELEKLTSRPMSAGVLERAWARMQFSPTVSPADFAVFLEGAKAAGFIRKHQSLEGLVQAPQ